MLMQSISIVTKSAKEDILDQYKTNNTMTVFQI